jgi:hypothetical protein
LSQRDAFGKKKIFLIRGQKVMFDFHLAELYGVETKALKRAVRRNMDRFPDDFVFELSDEEYHSLRSHFGTLKRGEHSKYLPFAFTEQGVSMLSSVLRSQRAVQVNIAIMRAFVRLRELISSQKELAHKLEELERRIESHDSEIQIIFEAIHKLMEPEVVEKPKHKIGFRIDEPKRRYSVTKK